MSWNYRIVHRAEKVGRHTFHRYGVHEAYCDDAGRVWAITERPVGPQGETRAELAEDWGEFSQAFAAPMLEYDQIPEPGAKHPADSGRSRPLKDYQKEREARLLANRKARALGSRSAKQPRRKA